MGARGFRCAAPPSAPISAHFAVCVTTTDVCNRNSRKILKKKWTFWSFVKKHFHAPQVMLVSAKVFGAIVCF